MKQRKKLQDLIDNMKKERNPSARELKTKIELLQHLINMILSKGIAKKIMVVRKNYFENVNKSGRWMAIKLRKEREKNLIFMAREEDGSEKHGQED